MITNNGTVVYDAVQTSFLEWRPANNVLRDFLLALITTIISFQAAGALVDLSFGLKRWGHASIADIQSLILVRESSPRQVIKNLFPVTFHRFWSSSKLSSLHSLDPSVPKAHPIRLIVLVRLFFLLCAIPLLNVVPLILVFEHDTVLSLSEARVGGFGLGVNMDFTAEGQVTTSLLCVRNEVQVRDREIPLMTIKMCGTLALTGPPDPSGMPFVRVTGDGGVVTVSVGSSERTAWSPVAGFLDITQNAVTTTDDLNATSSFTVGHALTTESAEELISYGRGLINVQICETESGPSIADFAPAEEESKYDFSVLKRFPCKRGESVSREMSVRRPTDKHFSGNAPVEVRVMELLLTKVTFINTGQVKLIDGSRSSGGEARQAQGETISGGDLPFLKRRRSYASFLTLVVLAGGVMGVRLLVLLLTRNDLEIGLGLMIRDVLKVACCDSMLAHSDVLVSYENDVLLSEKKANGNDDEAEELSHTDGERESV